MAGPLGLAAALAVAPAAQAEEDLVLGGSIPLSGVFAFAGQGIHAGITDYVKIVNDQGGIKGRKLRYVPEDTAYKVDASVAAFKKITSQNKVNFYYGDSTGFSKTVNAELNRAGNILMTGAVLRHRVERPGQVSGPVHAGAGLYRDVRHPAALHRQGKAGRQGRLRVFGHRVRPRSHRQLARRGREAGPEGGHRDHDAAGQRGRVHRGHQAAPRRSDYTIFHGYVLAPIPEFVGQGKRMGLKTRYMGTFWTMDNSTVMQMGEDAEGFMGVMPYRYYYDQAADAPMLKKIREMRPQYQSTGYMQGFLAAMLFTEAAKRTLDAGKDLSAANMKAALDGIKDFDTGGLIGVPISMKGNSIPVGRIYRADVKQKQMVPASDWIVLK